MQRLYEIGFQKVGRWTLQGGELVAQFDNLVNQQNVLYAFISGSEVKYVGKTTQSLQRRMFGYQKPNIDQRTNWRNRLAIVELLKQGHPVDILALPDTGLLRYGSFHLNLAAALEDSIIQTLKPTWNGARMSVSVESSSEAIPAATSSQAGLEEQPLEVVQAVTSTMPVTTGPEPVTLTPKQAPAPGAAPSANSQASRQAHGETSTLPRLPGHDAELIKAAPHFRLTLQETYHRTGFFNVPINCEKYFGRDMESITIYCGRENDVVTGKINRTANTNGTPRIMGQVPLRAWFQKRKPMSYLKVAILGPQTIHISDA